MKADRAWFFYMLVAALDADDAVLDDLAFELLPMMRCSGRSGADAARREVATID